MKKFTKKSLLLLIATALLLTATVSSTVAYLMAGTGEVVNTFKPGEAKTEIQETFDGTTKSNIAIKNTGNVSVYVRATIVGNWVDAQGNVISSWQPTEAELNTVYWEHRNGKEQGLNYYYFERILAPGATTPDLLNSPITNAECPPGAHHLEVTVLQQSIQADGVEDGMRIVQKYWAWGTAPTTVYTGSDIGN